MTLETLRKAKELEDELYKIDKFLDAVKRNSLIRFFREKKELRLLYLIIWEKHSCMSWHRSKEKNLSKC